MRQDLKSAIQNLLGQIEDPTADDPTIDELKQAERMINVIPDSLYPSHHSELLDWEVDMGSKLTYIWHYMLDVLASLPEEFITEDRENPHPIGSAIVHHFLEHFHVGTYRELHNPNHITSTFYITCKKTEMQWKVAAIELTNESDTIDVLVFTHSKFYANYCHYRNIEPSKFPRLTAMENES